jgi:hypothetical protein
MATPIASGRAFERFPKHTHDPFQISLQFELSTWFFHHSTVDKNVAAESAADDQYDPLAGSHLVKEEAA